MVAIFKSVSIENAVVNKHLEKTKLKINYTNIKIERKHN